MAAQDQLVQEGRERRPFDPTDCIVKHAPAILLFSLLTFAVLYPVGLLFRESYYEAEARLRIDPVVPKTMGKFDDASVAGYYDDYVETQVQIITSQGSMEDAFRRLSADMQKALMPGDSIPLSTWGNRVRRRLVVKHLRDSHIVSVALRAPRPNGLEEYVNALVTGYIAKTQKEQNSHDLQRLRDVEAEQARLSERDRRISVELTQVAERAMTGTFDAFHDNFSHALQVTQEAYRQAYGTFVREESHYRNLQHEIAELRKISVEPLIDEFVERDESLWDISFWTYETIGGLQASMYGLKADNPERRHIEKRIAHMETFLAETRQTVRERAVRIITAKRANELRQRLLAGEAAYRTAKEAKEKLTAALAAAEERVRHASRDFVRGKELQLEQQQVASLLENVSRRVIEMKLQAQSPGRVSLDTAARPPEAIAGSNLKRILFVLFALAFGGVTALTLYGEFHDERITRPRDIVMATGHPSSWPLSDYARRGRAGVPFHRVTVADTMSVVAKAIRSLAVRLDKERKANGAKVMQFTAVDPRSGTTEVALNTAHALTQLCRKVLLVEGNRTSAKLASLLGREPDAPGLVDVVSGRNALAECIFRDEERRLDVLPVGGRDAEGAAALDHLAVFDLFEDLGHAYDAVLIDSAAIMVSDLSEALATHADVVVLVVAGNRSVYSDLRRAVGVLCRLDVPALTVLLNWGGPEKRTRWQTVLARRSGPS